MTIGAPFSSGTGMNVPRDRRAPAGGGQNAITSGVISNVAGFKVMRAPGLPTGTSTKLYGVAAGDR